MPQTDRDKLLALAEADRLDAWISRAMRKACHALFYQGGLWAAIHRAAVRRDSLRAGADDAA